ADRIANGDGRTIPLPRGVAEILGIGADMLGYPIVTVALTVSPALDRQLLHRLQGLAVRNFGLVFLHVFAAQKQTGTGAQRAHKAVEVVVGALLLVPIDAVLG